MSSSTCIFSPPPEFPDWMDKRISHVQEPVARPERSRTYSVPTSMGRNTFTLKRKPVPHFADFESEPPLAPKSGLALKAVENCAMPARRLHHHASLPTLQRSKTSNSNTRSFKILSTRPSFASFKKFLAHLSPFSKKIRKESISLPVLQIPSPSPSPSSATSEEELEDDKPHRGGEATDAHDPPFPPSQYIYAKDLDVAFPRPVYSANHYRSAALPTLTEHSILENAAAEVRRSRQAVASLDRDSVEEPAPALRDLLKAYQPQHQAGSDSETGHLYSFQKYLEGDVLKSRWSTTSVMARTSEESASLYPESNDSVMGSGDQEIDLDATPTRDTFRRGMGRAF